MEYNIALRGVLQLSDESRTNLVKNYTLLKNAKIDFNKDFLVVKEIVDQFYEESAGFPRWSYIEKRLQDLQEFNLLKQLEGVKTTPFPSEEEYRFAIHRLVDFTKRNSVLEGLHAATDFLDSKKADPSINADYAQQAIDILMQKTNTLYSDTNNSGDEISTGGLAEGFEQCRSYYEKQENDPEANLYIPSGVKEIDERVGGGIRKGNLFFICGFMGSFKTGSCLSWALNAVTQGFNVLYITMENTYHELRCQSLSCHAANPIFFNPEINPVTHSDILHTKLDPMQKDFIFNRVYSDLVLKAGDRYGDLFIHNPTQSSFKVSDIRNICNHYDALCGNSLDMVVVDQPLLLHAQNGSTDYNSRNAIIRDLKLLALTFGYGRKLAMLCPHQINRDGHERAIKNGGVYDHKCIADLNEIERSADAVMTVFLDDSLKAAKEIQMQFLKSRHTELRFAPFLVSADLGARRMGAHLEEVELDDVHMIQQTCLNWEM